MSTCKRMWTDREIYSMADKKAKERIEAGQTSNAKPIYFHPIYAYIIVSSAVVLLFNCSILDNNPEKYTPTTLAAKLKQMMDDGDLITICGGVRANGEDTFKQAYLITKVGSAYAVYYFDGTSISNTTSYTSLAFTAVTDGVNKIN